MRRTESSSRRAGWWIVAAGLLLTGCASTAAASSEGTHPQPVTVEPVSGSDGLSRLTLTEQAAGRLALETDVVSQELVTHGDSEPRQSLAVPYAAIIYDPSGATWVYTSPEDLVFVRAPIAVAFIAGDTAALDTGPAVGTAVVTVGAAELYGAELGVDH